MTCMKRVLITGINSYIGCAVGKYLKEEGYEVTFLSQRGNDWLEHDFSVYDCVLDVTGIAHVDEGKLSEEEKQRYLQVNCELAVKTAAKAKHEGVKSFLFCSSILVYGGNYRIGEGIRITKESQPNPTNQYGASKWQAEQQLATLEAHDFKVMRLRIPFVYGPGCEGNYRLLSKWAGRFPVFPSIPGQKSMIYIENLSECIRKLMEKGESGVYFPQNDTYASTAELVTQIRKIQGKKTYLWKGLNPVVRVLAKMPGKGPRMLRKVFGSFVYDMDMSKVPENYQLVDLEESIRRTERKEI